MLVVIRTVALDLWLNRYLLFKREGVFDPLAKINNTFEKRYYLIVLFNASLIGCQSINGGTKHFFIGGASRKHNFYSIGQDM